MKYLFVSHRLYDIEMENEDNESKCNKTPLVSYFPRKSFVQAANYSFALFLSFSRRTLLRGTVLPSSSAAKKENTPAKSGAICSTSIRNINCHGTALIRCRSDVKTQRQQINNCIYRTFVSTGGNNMLGGSALFCMALRVNTCISIAERCSSFCLGEAAIKYTSGFIRDNFALYNLINQKKVRLCRM